MVSISRPAPLLRDDLPEGVLGMTDGTRIYLRSDLTQVEHRCVYEHELVHMQRGHTSCQPPAVERAVQQEVAKRLITLEDIRHVRRWASSPEEAAAELGVTVELYTLRLESLKSEGNPIFRRDDPLDTLAESPHAWLHYPQDPRHPAHR